MTLGFFRLLRRPKRVRKTRGGVRPRKRFFEESLSRKRFGLFWWSFGSGKGLDTPNLLLMRFGATENALVRADNSFLALGTWNVLVGAQTPNNGNVTHASLRLVSWQNVAGVWKTQKRISACR